MMSGDGLVVRVRPVLGRLSAAQASGLCLAAQTHGAGLIDVTNRANLQIRGVAAASHVPLLIALAELGLLDEDETIEARRNIVVAPDWTEGDETEWLALELAARLGELPALPAKMGFAIDAGAGPILTDVSADFRIERGVSGGLILRADGHGKGMPLPDMLEVETVIRLAWWFANSGGAQAGRMRRHAAPLPAWFTATEAPATPRLPLGAGPHAMGAIHGTAFGQVPAQDLAAAITDSGAQALRVTPWRALVLEGGAAGPRDGLEWDANAPVLRVDACAGAPLCPQAQVQTRALARALAPYVDGRLHVSGCDKGCARSTPSDVVISGRGGAYTLARNTRADDTDAQTGLSAHDLLTHFGAPLDAL